MRVGVVGGGMAGAAAAWSLSRAGHRVDLFEARASLGGNARVHTWREGDRALTAGLAVLAWPPTYFRSYERLLAELAIETEPVRLRFLVHTREGSFAQERGGALYERHRDDFARWRALISRLRAFNRRFDAGPPSLYRAALRNPLTYLPAWPLARAAGVSRPFWDRIVRAIYGSSFLTTRLEALPAFILPTIDDMISVEDGGRMRTWKRDSGAVFDALAAQVSGRVHLGRAIVRVRWVRGEVRLTDARGEEHAYDRVVLAADASRMADALPDGVARRILASVRYVEARDPSFADGVAHGDAAVLPAPVRELALADYCTLIDVDGDRYRNHFIVSSWAPVARGTGARMIVSYPAHAEVNGAAFRFENRGSHPEFGLRNLGLARALRSQQGREGIYYCGAYVTPGNGHDLSLLSGLVAASALGAPYPFPDDLEAAADFELLRRQMLGRA